MNIHIQSISPQYEWPSILGLMLALVSKVSAMGLIHGAVVPSLDETAVGHIFDALQNAGLMRLQRARVESLLKASPGEEPSAEAIQALKQVVESLDESPVPGTEWGTMRGVFGDEELSALLGISLSSLKRYASADLGQRRNTPLDVADRLHWLAMTVAELAGSYNEFGVRRWFERPRATLGNRSPRQCLGKNWTSDSTAAKQVRKLAASLSGMGAT